MGMVLHGLKTALKWLPAGGSCSTTFHYNLVQVLIIKKGNQDE